MGVKTSQYFILNCFVISSNIRESGIPELCPMPRKVPKQRERDRILQIQKNNKISIYLGLGQVKTLSGPSDAARKDQGGRALRLRVRLSYDTFLAERCGQDRLSGRELRPHALHLRPHQLTVSTQASHRYYLQNSIPLSLFWNFPGHCTQHKNPTLPKYHLFGLF